jgi:hypothetical protein
VMNGLSWDFFCGVMLTPDYGKGGGVRGGVISKSTGAICAKGGVKTPRLAPVCRKRIDRSDNVDYVKFQFLHATYK